MSQQETRESLKKHLETVIQEHSTEMERAADRLPAMDALVVHPTLGVKLPLQVAIYNLNDSCQWSREQIADWLDTLHESGMLDLEFKEGE